MKREKDTWEQLRDAIKEDRTEDGTVEALYDKRRQEVEAELPHPQCCDLAKKLLFPYRDIDHRTEVVRNNGVPIWKSSFSTRWHSEGYRETHAIHFCPFCGTKLPSFRKKKNPPQHPCIEGDYHCGSCHERWDGCFCSYPESAFEVKG